MKHVERYTEDSSKILVRESGPFFVIIVSNEDIDAVMPLNLKSQFSKGNERCLIWADKRSLSLTRFIKEGCDPRDDMAKLYVRHLNGDTMDFRRDNLAWSLGKSGRIITPEVGDRHDLERKKLLEWQGHRLLFLTDEEREDARKRLEAGESVFNILQTGRQRFRRDTLYIAGESAADWARWLRGRHKEISEIREWLLDIRPPRPFEDPQFKAMMMEAWKFADTEDCRMLAQCIAMWMDRKTQATPVLEPDDYGGLRRVNVLAKNYTYRDPFDDFQELFSEFYKNKATPEMPVVKASFSLESEVE